jgi:hypothetical protein
MKRLIDGKWIVWIFLILEDAMGTEKLNEGIRKFA